MLQAQGRHQESLNFHERSHMILPHAKMKDDQGNPNRACGAAGRPFQTRPRCSRTLISLRSQPGCAYRNLMSSLRFSRRA